LLASQGNEVSHILGMLQDTVIKIAGEHTRSAKRLREETLQQKADAAATVQKLQTIERGQSGTMAKPSNRSDAVTGLLCRDDAIIAMQAAIEGCARQYAVAMVVNRVQMINTRFGQEVGDRMLVGFKFACR
jgi:PleD family two-component response regulator